MENGERPLVFRRSDTFPEGKDPRINYDTNALVEQGIVTPDKLKEFEPGTRVKLRGTTSEGVVQGSVFGMDDRMTGEEVAVVKVDGIGSVKLDDLEIIGEAKGETAGIQE